jgi:ribosomal-protein-alanine N-acetyltransferase
LDQLPPQNRFDDEHPKLATLTFAAYKKRLKSFEIQAKTLELFKFGIFDLRTGQILGGLDLHLFDRRVRWANLGYVIRNQHWGKGYATEASKLALKLAFGPIHLHRVEASCELGNKASARVALKAGLQHEGIRRKFFSTNGGIDLRVFAENSIDYRKRRR